jgi:hypothetical protein
LDDSATFDILPAQIAGKRAIMRLFKGAAAALVFWVCIHAAAARGQQAQPVSVGIDMIPLIRTVQLYDPAAPPPQMPPPEANEAGVTISEFSCTAVVDGLVLNQGPSRDSTATVAAVRVQSVHITIGLKITEWVSCHSGLKILAHEDGHAMISEHFYDGASEIAEDIGHDLIGHDFFGSGADTPSAASDALNVAARQIAQQYMQQVRDPSQRVQEAYDVITQHGTNTVEELDAIEQAMNQVRESDKSGQE